MKSLRIVGVVFVMIIITCSLSLADGWQIESVGTGNVGGYISMALDGDDYPHI